MGNDRVRLKAVRRPGLTHFHLQGTARRAEGGPARRPGSEPRGDPGRHPARQAPRRPRYRPAAPIPAPDRPRSPSSWPRSANSPSSSPRTKKSSSSRPAETEGARNGFTIDDAPRPYAAPNLGRMRRISILEAGLIASAGLSHVGGGRKCHTDLRSWPAHVDAQPPVPDRGPDPVREPAVPRVVHHGRHLPAPSAIRLGPGPRRGHREPEDRGRSPEGAG